MNVVKPALYIGVVVNVLNILLCWIFIAKLGLGVVGAAICQVCREDRGCNKYMKSVSFSLLSSPP